MCFAVFTSEKNRFVISVINSTYKSVRVKIQSESGIYLSAILIEALNEDHGDHLEPCWFCWTDDHNQLDHNSLFSHSAHCFEVCSVSSNQKSLQNVWAKVIASQWCWANRPAPVCNTTMFSFPTRVPLRISQRRYIILQHNETISQYWVKRYFTELNSIWWNCFIFTAFTPKEKHDQIDRKKVEQNIERKRKCRLIKFNDIYRFSEIQAAITLHALACIYNLICMQLIVNLQKSTQKSGFGAVISFPLFKFYLFQTWTH